MSVILHPDGLHYLYVGTAGRGQVNADDRFERLGIRTVNGVELGNSIEILERRFPGRVWQDFSNYDLPSTPGARSFVAYVLEGPFKWRFYVEDGKISHISSGYVFAEDLCAD